MLNRYLPDHFIRCYDDISASRHINILGYVMHIELSGYNKNCLSVLSKENANTIEISEITDKIYEVIFPELHKKGGSIYRADGGTVVAFFPGTVHSRTVNNCGMNIISAFSRLKSQEKKSAISKTAIMIGISYGETVIGIFGNSEKEYFIAGKAAEKAEDCAKEAVIGEQIISCSMRSKLGMCEFKTKKECYFISEKLEELFDLKLYEKPSQANIRTELFGSRILSYFEKQHKRGRFSDKFSCLKIQADSKNSEIMKSYQQLNGIISEIIRISQSYAGYIEGINISLDQSEITIVFGISEQNKNSSESAARASLEISQVVQNPKGLRMCLTTGSGFCFTAGADGKYFFNSIGDFIVRNERLLKTAAPGEIIIDNNSLSEIPDASVENERLQGFRGLKEKCRIYSLKPFAEKHNVSCEKMPGIEKEIAEFEVLCVDQRIKKVFINSSSFSSGFIADRFSTTASKFGHAHIVRCRTRSSDFPYYSIKMLINSMLDDISSDRDYALKNILEDIGESNNTLFYSLFLKDQIDGISKHAALKNLFEDVSLSIVSHYTSRARVFVFFSGAEFIDRESALLLVRFFETESERIKACFTFIYENEMKVTVLKDTADEGFLTISQPDKNEGSVLNSIDQLEINCKQVLSYLAAAGSSTEIRFLKNVIGRNSGNEEKEIDKCIKILCEKCIIASAQSKQDEYIFISKAVREKSFSLIADDQRKVIHSAFASFFEADFLNGNCFSLPSVLKHLKLTENKEKLNKYLIQASRSALSNYSPQAASIFISDANMFAPGSDNSMDTDLVGALIRYKEGKFEESKIICESIIETSSSGSDILAKTIYLKTKILYESRMFKEAVEASSPADKMKEDDLSIKIMCLKGLSLLASGMVSEADTLSSNVYAFKNVVNDGSVLAAIYELSGTLNLNAGKYKLARAYYEDMFRISQEQGLPLEKLISIKLTGLSFEKEGDSRKALEALDKLCTESLKLHNFEHAVYCIDRFRHNSKGYANQKKIDLFAKRWFNAAVKFKRYDTADKIGVYIKNNSEQYF